MRSKKLQESNLIWNSELYFECVAYLMDKIEKKKIVLDKKKFIDLVNEVYFYSARSEAKGVDKYFVDWIIDKTKEL